jgi:hypothetical protein
VRDEGHDFGMRNYGGVVYLRVVRQQPLTPAAFTYEELSEDEVVPTHFLAAQELVEFRSARLAIGQETDPDGGIDQNNHAAEWSPTKGRSRRRRDARACGSEPGSARSRS